MIEPLRHRPGRRRNQAGFTLIELLLAAALTAILVGPLAAWTITTVRQHGAMGEHLSNATATGRVSSAFVGDVASARTVTAGAGGDCTGGGPGGGGTVRLSLISAGATSTRIVYTEARPRGADPSSAERSLWRRECTSSGTLARADELFPSIEPGSAVAACPLPGQTPPASDCASVTARRVQLRATPAGPGRSPREIRWNATRRADAGSVGIPGSGNRPPVAQIQVDSLVGFIGVPFRFSGAGSEDLDGLLAASAYRWELPGAGGATEERTGAQIDHAFSVVGEHTVLLEVTDSDGAVNVAAITVRVVNRHPTAEATVAPETGEVGTTSFHFDATASADGDADALTYRWDLGPDASGNPITDTRAVFDMIFPAGSPEGPRRITLTIEDPRGGRDVRVLQVGLNGPGSIGGITINPEPVITGGVPVVGTVGAGRPDLRVSFSLLSGDPTASSWRLSTAEGAVVATGPGATLDHLFGPNDHGEYRIARVSPSGQLVGTERAFRVNAAPVAAFTTSGGSTDAPRAVTFSTAGSSDLEGPLVAWRWDFGFASWTSSDASPTHVFTHPGNYSVRLSVTDSDGATSSFVQQVVVTGPIPAPTAPTWSGDQIVIDPVPGAEAYRVQVTCGGVAVTVPGNEFAASPAPSLTLPVGTCAAPAVASATYELRAAGVWSATSPPGVRP
ncbi:MAG: PKD domain-containing protein [Actinomycetota bacterium]|nr:PKD domain-containing protein [Actinomycetota bacterium]